MGAKRTGWRRVGRWLSWGILGALVVYVGVAATGRWTVLGELASQFRFYFGFVALAACLIFAAGRHWRKAALAAALVLWGSWPEGGLWPWSAGEPSRSEAATVALPSGPRGGGSHPTASVDAPGSPVFHMVCSNVLRPNVRYRELLEAVLESDPDVIGFLEFSSDWRDAAIERLSADYPYHVEALNTTGWNPFTWGLMLFSKTEIVSFEVLKIDFDEWALRPMLQATIAEPLDLTITLAHPERPGKPARMRARRLALETIAASDVEGPWLVIGDLNTTSTSPLFRDLVQATGLRDSRVGFGRLPTWEFGNRLPGPLPLPLPSWLRISVAIDHALYRDGLRVVDRSTLYAPGSDHRAVSVTLAGR
ncbi:hypothetical protein Poly30_47640 [Planctomycetes bacterium Poly30]|uniref:Endonuclease/exonuclease/phosphatase domain-containing protein n=1 Tax=Saltatorellus ferox TaxID=2528018 RepID=A0A518EYP2_9BACT|nr:hypothetical protein Poly30_47640 [Planctomycetes bacterium Poly30]